MLKIFSFCGSNNKIQPINTTWSTRVLTAVLGCNLKNHRMISVHFPGKPFNIMVIQAYAPTRKAEEAEVEQFNEDLQDLSELHQKKMSFTL